MYKESIQTSLLSIQIDKHETLHVIVLYRACTSDPSFNAPVYSSKKLGNPFKS